MESNSSMLQLPLTEKSVPNFVSKYEKKKIQKMTEILKSCNHFRELFYFIFVSGITFLYILTSTDGEIVAGLRFSNYIYHFTRGHFNMESYRGKKKLLLIFPGR